MRFEDDEWLGSSKQIGGEDRNPQRCNKPNKRGILSGVSGEEQAKPGGAARRRAEFVESFAGGKKSEQL